MTRKSQIKRGVMSTLLVVALIMPLSVPAAAHSATYCGHGAITHVHSPFLYRHEFAGTIANFPVHEHAKRHWVSDGGPWSLLHSTSLAC